MESTASRAVSAKLKSIAPRRATLKTDLMAGLPGAIGSVPDGMAASVLTGVNPIHGLYASFAGPIAGGLTASTKLMVITTTSAAALAAGSAVENLDADDRPAALFLLTLLAGGVMIAAGILRLGRFTRFVSHSVMVGFLTGVSVNIILGQLPDLTGAPSEGSVALEKAWNVITNPADIMLASVLTGVAAFAIIAALARTRIASFGAVVALAVPTIIVALTGADVAQVQDQGDIPRGVPLPALPQISAFSWSLVAGALAVAAIVLVQGVGVAESAPNMDGSRSHTNADFIAQGVGNVGSSLFRGIPVGGSVGQTALNRTAGARSRWASILSGVWMILILMVFSGVVGEVAMPTLAALLIFAGIGSLHFMQIRSIWHTGLNSQIAIAATFVATLLLPVAAAVGLGVVLSLLLQLNQSALDLKVVALIPRGDGQLEERPAPLRLADHTVTMLDVYGSLQYAGARTLERLLPRPDQAEYAAVVLRMRGRMTFGSTFLTVIANYADQLAEAHGRLYVTGLDPTVIAQAERSGTVPDDGRITLYEASSVIGTSSLRAYHDAQQWLDGNPPDRSV